MLHRDKRLLLYLFVAFRLMLLIAYQPFLLNGVERGLTVFGDFQHYFNVASLSSSGSLPYRDYWYEFPPVFPAISLTVYTLTGGQAGGFTAYATALGLFMIIVDVGNLLLLQRLGTRLHKEETGTTLAWTYALLAVPLVFSMWTFEPLVCFFILLAITWLVEGQDNRAAVAIALGALTKLYPLILLAGVWRMRKLAQAIRVTVISGVITALGITAMLLYGGKFGLPSLSAQFNKASYQTVWALIDGNYRTGNFGPITDHFVPEKATELLGNPSRVPWWLRGLIFGAIGLFIYARTRRFDERGLVAFVSVTVIVFFLWSQGWSPQWQMVLVPLILLNFPTRSGVLTALMLSLVSFIEYPLLFMRTGDTGGAISGAQLPIFAVLIAIRTLILIGLAVGLYQLLRQERRPSQA
ncbi:MAG: DUF2029 domain-containing protein [Anaerolineae bacterium]|nr:DUF2029 domain-containing protein [Anaerolineae bacterium]